VGQCLVIALNLNYELTITMLAVQGYEFWVMSEKRTVSVA